jgi:hypothetical protein
MCVLDADNGGCQMRNVGLIRRARALRPDDPTCGSRNG